MLFLVKNCLHKVEPAYATRFALTNWWLEPNYKPGQRTDVSISVRTAHTSGPQRYAVLPDDARHDVVRGLDKMRGGKQ